MQNYQANQVIQNRCLPPIFTVSNEAEEGELQKIGRQLFPSNFALRGSTRWEVIFTKHFLTFFSQNVFAFSKTPLHLQNIYNPFNFPSHSRFHILSYLINKIKVQARFITSLI